MLEAVENRIEQETEKPLLMKTLAQRLRYSREKAKLSQSELARRVGIKPQAIQFIESGKVYKPRNILEIAEEVGVDAVWLSTGKGNMTTQPKLGPGGRVQTQVPLISWQHAKAWDEAALEMCMANPEQMWIPTTANVSDHAFALEVKGDSMEPEFASNDIIVVDPDRKYRQGSFVVAQLQKNPEAVLRELVVDGGVEYLKPLNQRYQIEVRKESDQICGTVVYKSKAYLAEY